MWQGTCLTKPLTPADETALREILDGAWYEDTLKAYRHAMHAAFALGRASGWQAGAEAQRASHEHFWCGSTHQPEMGKHKDTERAREFCAAWKGACAPLVTDDQHTSVSGERDGERQEFKANLTAEIVRLTKDRDEWRHAFEAWGYFGDPDTARRALVDIIAAKDKHHDEHHAREAVDGELLMRSVSVLQAADLALETDKNVAGVRLSIKSLLADLDEALVGDDK